MAISVVGSDTSNSATANVTMDLPVGTAQNDVSYAAIANRSTLNRSLSAVTADYAELCDLYANDSSDSQLGVYRKVQGATPDSTVELTQGTANGCNGLVIVLRGVDTTTPEDATPTTATIGDTGTPDPPSIDTATAGAWVLPFVSSSETDTVSNAPTNYTNLVAESTTGLFATPVAVSTREISSPGTEDPGEYADLVGDTTDSYCACTVAVKPAAGGGGDALTADDIATAAPTVASPALHQVHALLANDVATAAPTAGSPALHQAHALLADDVAAAAPTLGTPALSETHPLLADDVAAGAPTAGSPALAQVHALLADDIVATPTVASAALAQAHALTADDVATAAPTADSPALGQVHALAADDVASAAPFLSSPALSENGAPAALLVPLAGMVANPGALMTRH